MEDIYNLGIKALIRNEDGEILLLKVDSSNFQDDSNGGYWDIPGGRVEVGDTVEGTLRREIKEEIGVQGVRINRNVGMYLSNIRFKNRYFSVEQGLILSVYECVLPEGSTIDLSEEHTEYAYFSPEGAGELLSVKYPEEITDKIKALA